MQAPAWPWLAFVARAGLVVHRVSIGASGRGDARREEARASA